MTIATKTKNENDNLCDYCANKFPTCRQSYIKFGNGIGKDNVIVCTEFTTKSFDKIYPIEALTNSCGEVIKGFLRSSDPRFGTKEEEHINKTLLSRIRS